jgi:putative DNA primase/helicase
MNNTPEMNNEEHNRGTRSDNQSVTKNNSSCLVISEVSAQSDGDPEVIPLTQLSGLPVEKFDFDLLPSSLQPWAKDLQHRLQCPADYVGVSIMIGLATSVGNKITVQPKANDHTWLVVPNQWGLLIGQPSSMKSPAMDSALKHIHKMQEVLMSQNKSYRMMVKDTTVEQLQIIQSKNSAGILYVQDEISSLFRKFEQPSNNDRQYLLEAFNGNSSYSVDRISRASVFIEKNTLSLLGTIQPDVLQSIFLSNASSNDGFMQRLQLAVWPDPIQQEYVDELPNEEADRTAWAVFTTLYQLEERTLCFSSDAQKVFTDWYKQSINIINELSAEEDQSSLVNHLTKYRKMVPALALLIELAEDHQATEIMEGSIARAVIWANYLITHAKRIYGIQDKAAIIAENIVNKREKLNATFSPSEIAQNNWSRLNSTEEVRLGIELLVKHNYLIKLDSTTGKKGGRPSERYRWNHQLQ